jgi:alkanesulfonate monooxygenase SsuD/methylene tetrahydromethanopterin reductase-like flavin-dependent oxidoreductase (luciferase family)
MKFGYFLNHNNLGSRLPYGQVLANGREIAKYCDETGWESLWTTEHHFGHEGLEVCPNPILMSADLAARTQRLRIGQAANIITFRHPVQLAEDLALLDHLCDGRLDVAVGRGIYPRESINMNPIADVRNPQVNRELFEETLAIMRGAWTEEFFSHKGKYYEFPYPGVSFDHPMSPPHPQNTDPSSGQLTALGLVPRPLQTPHPPLWQVIDTPTSIRFAGAQGLKGLFWIPPTQALLERFEMYRDAASEAVGEDIPLGRNVGVLRDMFVAPTMAEAEAIGGQGILNYMRWVCHYRGLGNHCFPGEVLEPTPGKLDHLSYDWLHPRNLLFGTPEYVCEQIEQMRETLNLETLLVWSSFPGVPHEAAMDSIRLFTEEVMPHFTDGFSHGANLA